MPAHQSKIIKIKRKPKSNVKKVPESIAPGKGEVFPPIKQQKTRKNVHNVELDEDVDFETLVKEEYLRLQRQYRLMEDARRLLAEKGNNLSRQGRILERLSAEKLNLATDLYNAESQAFKDRDAASTKTVLQILEDYEIAKSNIKLCRRDVREMEDNVDKITKRLLEQKLKVLAIYGSSMTAQQAEHRQRILENRLYHTTTQLDTKVSTNKLLRDEINMLIRLRGVFYERMIALKKQVNKVKFRMGEVVFLATTAYEQRDDWALRIRSIREKNDKDSKAHVLELKELNRLLHHDSKLHGFMTKKTQERQLTETQLQRNDRKNLKKLNEVTATLAKYTKSFNDILKYSRAQSIQFLITDYLNTEQINFARFKYIADINAEIKALQEQSLLIAKDIEQYYFRIKKSKENEIEKVKSHQKDYQEERLRMKAAIEIRNKAEKQMSEYIVMFSAVFNMAGCDKTPIMTMLGKFRGIDPRNLKLCLQILEARVNELANRKYEFETRKAVELDHHPAHKYAAAAAGPMHITHGTDQQKHSGGPFLPKVTVTLRGEAEAEDEGEEKGDHPFEYHEIKIMVTEELHKLHIPSAGSSHGNASVAQSTESMMHKPSLS